MGKIKNTRAHVLIDLENIELSLSGTLENGERHRIMLNEMIEDLIQKKNLPDHQIHIFMTTKEGVDWTFKKRDKFEKHFKYNVVSSNTKRFSDSEHTKADMDAAMGTVLGIISSKPETEEVWILTGDGDYVPAVTLLQREFPHIKINVGCVPQTAKGDLLKIAYDTYYINPDTPGIYIEKLTY